MCYHTTLRKTTDTLEQIFEAELNADIDFFDHDWNGFSFPFTPVITNRAPNRIQLFQWGLVPSSQQHKQIQAYTLNAKIETLHEKPSFAKYTEQRCWVIVDGFTEWQWLDKQGKSKQPYFIYAPQHEVFVMAGIWREWPNIETGEILSTYCILTTQANEQLAPIHNAKKRMPVILDHHNQHHWLAGAPIQEFTQVSRIMKTKKITSQSSLFD